MLIPRQKVPTLDLDTLSHGHFSLAKDSPDRFTLVAFYRGLHCPICMSYLKELENLTPEFKERGVKTIAVSTDPLDKAQAMAEKINASSLRMAYGLELSVAKEWGLYISTSRGKTSTGIEEPALFSEPGVFLVRPDQTLYYSSVQTMPFARPNFKEMLQGLDFVIANNYPARGEYTGAI